MLELGDCLVQPLLALEKIDQQQVTLGIVGGIRNRLAQNRLCLVVLVGLRIVLGQCHPVLQLVRLVLNECDQQRLGLVIFLALEILIDKT